ncbi:hypothetical protein RhiirA4_471330 [Rhizophagus irregularis]|uniref:MULE transposase domain-containing protein n=1 Tax=Rhizophagus irregularis TaxID=588596 RepID=A0A2I1H2Y5_9GLOM|nr:hypothetical protein RhiirA4_471330 [Rhizophagus irregularis]
MKDKNLMSVFPKTHHIQCLFHLYQNFLKNLRSCLGSSLYQEFIKDFMTIQCSHCETSTLQYTQPFVIQTFFSGIDDIIKKYLTQPIHDAHYKQMYQSVCYYAYQISFSEISVSDDEPFFDKEMNDSDETLIEADEDRELNLKSLISLVDPNNILEI